MTMIYVCSCLFLCLGKQIDRLKAELAHRLFPSYIVFYSISCSIFFCHRFSCLIFFWHRECVFFACQSSTVMTHLCLHLFSQNILSWILWVITNPFENEKKNVFFFQKEALLWFFFRTKHTSSVLNRRIL